MQLNKILLNTKNSWGAVSYQLVQVTCMIYNDSEMEVSET